MKRPWDVQRAMVIGAVLAGAYVAMKVMLRTGLADGGDLLTYQVVEVASAALFGAVFGWVFARIRNRLAR